MDELTVVSKLSVKVAHRKISIQIRLISKLKKLMYNKKVLYETFNGVMAFQGTSFVSW